VRALHKPTDPVACARAYSELHLNFAAGDALQVEPDFLRHA
jgi:hypothetical protein